VNIHRSDRGDTCTGVGGGKLSRASELLSAMIRLGSSSWANRHSQSDGFSTMTSVSSHTCSSNYCRRSFMVAFMCPIVFDIAAMLIASSLISDE
jgi:hypothetical protein